MGKPGKVKNCYIVPPVNVTLNGKPAIVCGNSNSFATVKAIDSAEQAQFSWNAVERIQAKGGNFRA